MSSKLKPPVITFEGEKTELERELYSRFRLTLIMCKPKHVELTGLQLTFHHCMPLGEIDAKCFCTDNFCSVLCKQQEFCIILLLHVEISKILVPNVSCDNIFFFQIWKNCKVVLAQRKTSFCFYGNLVIHHSAEVERLHQPASGICAPITSIFICNDN